MSLFTLFRQTIKPKSGILPDIRSIEEKDKDFDTKEVLSATPLVWPTWEEWIARPENAKMLSDVAVNFQGNVGSCGAQSSSLNIALHNYLEDGVFIKMSARGVYSQRVNKPNEGMYQDDIGKISISSPTVPEVLFPSGNDTDANMSNRSGWISAFESFSRILSSKAYFYLKDTTNIDSFAQVLATNNPIIFTTIFGDNEWGKALVPTIDVLHSPKYGHSNCFLPRGYFTYQGKKCLLGQDSWGTDIGIGGRRFINEDWFKGGRILPSIWTADRKNLETFNSSHASFDKHTFDVDMKVGNRGDEVWWLQLCLSCEKDANGYLFPLVQQKPTGYYGGITRNAVMRFQAKCGLPVDGICGIAVRNALNAIYG